MKRRCSEQEDSANSDSSDSSVTLHCTFDPDNFAGKYSINDEVPAGDIGTWMELLERRNICGGSIKQSQSKAGSQLCIEIQITTWRKERINHRIYLNPPLSNRVCDPFPHLDLLLVELNFGRIFLLGGGCAKIEHILDQETGRVDTQAYYDYSLFRERLGEYLQRYSWGTDGVRPAESLPSDARISINQFISFFGSREQFIMIAKAVGDTKRPKRTRTEGHSIKTKLAQKGKEILALLRRLDGSIEVLADIREMALILDPSDVCQPGDFALGRMALCFVLEVLEVIGGLSVLIKKLAIENAADQNAGRNTQPDAHGLVGALQMIGTAPELMNARLAVQVLASAYYQAHITSLGVVPCNSTYKKPEDSDPPEAKPHRNCILVYRAS